MADLTLFENIDFGGRQKEITQSQQSLGDFDRITSSIVIRNGHWQFFTDINCQGQPKGIGTSPSFGPGTYSWVEAVGIPNDAIRSVKLVG